MLMDRVHGFAKCRKQSYFSRYLVTKEQTIELMHIVNILKCIHMFKYRINATRPPTEKNSINTFQILEETKEVMIEAFTHF